MRKKTPNQPPNPYTQPNQFCLHAFKKHTKSINPTCQPANLWAVRVKVWKDVDGMLTADPRVVSTAVPVESVTFDEASELAYFGAKILHPISMAFVETTSGSCLNSLSVGIILRNRTTRL